jgi:SAM-dependent methyltransferase
MNLKDTLSAIKKTPRFIPSAFLLGLLYFFKNPFRLSKRYWIEKKASEVDVYGETPLATLEKIAARAHISPEDTFYDLGMGRGKGCFYMKALTGCKVVGIEVIPEFVKKAEQVKQILNLKEIWFSLKDLEAADLSRGSVFYLYGNFLSDALLLDLGKKLAALPKGTKVVSVSFPITDYASGYELTDHFVGTFPWGSTDIYLCKKT